jgi:uncharacterized protein (DUF58 family)
VGNPGVYSSPTEGWAFVPFLGVALALALIVVAVLYWMAGRRLRIIAALFTIAALVLSAGSVLGLFAAATSFELRDSVAVAEHSVKVQEWVEFEYGVTLSRDDVVDLVRGRPAPVEFNRGTINVHLRPIPGGTGVYLVGPDGSPIP